MKLASFTALASVLLLTPALSYAGFKGSIEFTAEEKAKHVDQLDNIMHAAADCLEADITRHKMFMKKYDISAFYGDNSNFAKVTNGDGSIRYTSKDEKRELLRKAGINRNFLQELIPDAECKGGIDECPNMMQPTSCIGMVMKCLAKGFRSVGHEESWQKLRRYAIANGVQGDALLDGLQKLGWKILYWNPDVSLNKKRDQKDQRDYPGNPKNVWGQHEATWQTVLNKRRYYFNEVDDYSSLVNFGKKPPRWMRDVPFFIGIAHLGYHVFPGTYGDVVEAHSARPITDKETIEKSEFSPGSRKGGPRGGMYLSGIMGIPPGYGANSPRTNSRERDYNEEDLSNDFQREDYRR